MFDQLSAIDIDDNHIDFCKRNHDGIQFKVGDAHDIQYPTDSFDIVTNVESAGYYDIDTFVHSVSKVLKSNGLFICAVPIPSYKLDVFHDSLLSRSFHVEKVLDITNNVATACGIEKYRMTRFCNEFAEQLLSDDIRYVKYRLEQNEQKIHYYLIVSRKVAGNE
jgi:SAM-dependent methyltransferase